MGWRPPALWGSKNETNEEIAAYGSSEDSKYTSQTISKAHEVGVVDNDDQVQPGGLSLSEDAAGGLGRHLGLMSTTFLIIGRIIGVGIFSTPGSVTLGVGSVGASLMLWLLGALLAFSGLSVWLEFGCMFPRSGGEKVYLEAVYTYVVESLWVLSDIRAAQSAAGADTGAGDRHISLQLFSPPKPSLWGLLVRIVKSMGEASMADFYPASGCIIFAQNILVAAGHSSIAEWAERGIAIGVIVFVTIIHTFTPKIGKYNLRAESEEPTGQYLSARRSTLLNISQAIGSVSLRKSSLR